jgi:hypothetical protein
MMSRGSHGARFAERAVASVNGPPICARSVDRQRYGATMCEKPVSMGSSVDLRLDTPLRAQALAHIASVWICAAALTTTGAISAQDASAPRIEGIVLDWAGPYLVSESHPVRDPRDPTGNRFVSSQPAPLPQTDRIALNLGVRFGIGFTLQGITTGEPVAVRRVWRFPAITNPQTSVTTSRAENNFICRMNEPCFTGQVLNQEFELVPGNWTVELWSGSNKILEHSFELFRP